MTYSRYLRMLLTQYWKQLETFSTEDEARLAPAILAEGRTLFQPLTPQAILAWRKAGITEIMPDPEQLWFFHRVAETAEVELERLGDGRSYLERFLAQTPLRLAWEADLERLQGAGSDPAMTWEKRILQQVAQDGLCQRGLLEAQMGVSFSTISRAVKKLIEQGLIEDAPVVEGPGRPVGVLRLSAAGQQLAKELGFPVSPIPDDSANGAIQEQFLHQKVAAIYLEHYPGVPTYRAYTVPPAPMISSPLGSIFPDLVVELPDQQVFIEVESGKYDYRRLCDKLDKYLAGPAPAVWVIAERQNAPTLHHVTQWLHDRRQAPLEGVDPQCNLAIHTTTVDLLQRHGPRGTIWRTQRYRNEE